MKCQIFYSALLIIMVLLSSIGCNDIDYPTDVLDKSPYDMSGGIFVINNDDEFAYSQSVVIECTVDNATLMQFSNDAATWSSWQPYAQSTQWILPLRYGEHVVYGQFQNSRGDIVQYSDSIFFIERLVYKADTYLGGDVAVSADGSVVVAGSYEGNTNAVYVFRKQVLDWHCTVINPNDIQQGDKFGYSVALSGNGNWLFVGAPVKKAVYVYLYSGTSWQLLQIITSNETNFGHVVSASYDGTYFCTVSTNRIFAYKYAQGQNKFVNFVVNGSDLHNIRNITISADATRIFAAYWDTSTEGVMSFLRYSDCFNPISSIKPDTYQQGSCFGQAIAVAADNSLLVIGRPFYDSEQIIDDDKGSCFVYTINNNNTFSLVYEVINDNGQPGDALGKAVAITYNNTIVVSMPAADNGTVDRGCVLVYRIQGSNCLLIANYYPDDRNTKCFFGESLAVSNTGVIAIGAPYAYANNSNDNGGVVYIRRLQ